MSRPPAVGRAPGFARGMVGLCAVIIGVSPGWSLVSTLGLTFHTQLHLSTVGVGVLAACVSIGYVLTSLPLGSVIDRSGGQAMLTGAPAVLAVALVVLVLVDSVPALVVVALLAGALWSGCVVATNRYTVLIAPIGRRGLAMGVIQATTMLASGLAAFVLPRVASRWTWREAVLLLGLVAVLAGTTARAAFRGRHRVPSPDPPPASRRGVRFPREFHALLGFGVAMGVVMHCTWTFLLIYLADAGASTSRASVALALLFVCGGGGRLLWGLLVDRGANLWALLVLSALGGAVAVLALQLQPGGSWAFVPVVAIGVLVLGHNTMFILAGLRMVPPAASAVAGAALTSSHVVGGVVGPPLFALVVERGGGYGAAWAALAALLVLSLAALRVASRHRAR